MQYWRRQWQPTPALLPGKSHGRRSLGGYSPWGRKEPDMTERLHFTPFSVSASMHHSDAMSVCCSFPFCVSFVTLCYKSILASQNDLKCPFYVLDLLKHLWEFLVSATLNTQKLNLNLLSIFFQQWQGYLRLNFPPLSRPILITNTLSGTCVFHRDVQVYQHRVVCKIFSKCLNSVI